MTSAKRLALGALAAAAVSLTGVATGGATTLAQGAIGFAPPVFVDATKAGGEPFVAYSAIGNDLVYTSHEGTTHIDRSFAPAGLADFVCPNPARVPPECYSNHVWIWTSKDHGKTWQPSDEGLSNTGFSDPDLSIDEAGNIYDTGINLVNDTVFGSTDGGKTWVGTVNCHEGDRPWLAGGRAGEVYMATDAATGPGNGINGGHIIFRGTLGAGGTSFACNGQPAFGGVADFGNYGSGTYSGFNKLYYDHLDPLGALIEPAVFHHGNTTGVGISVLRNPADAFNGGSEVFVPKELFNDTTVMSPFGAPSIALDSAENIYVAWDTDDRVPNSSGGCPNYTNIPPGNNNTPAPNHIKFISGKHVGPPGAATWQFSPAVDLASPANGRVEWPWVQAGSAGRVSVVWYALDKLTDPDCDQLNGVTQNPNTRIMAASIVNATDPATRQVSTVDAAGRPVHQGGICNSGTTCVATGQDRRLGDFFTNAVDERGCVMIASGDTTQPDPVTGGGRITSLPIFVQQNSGPSLTGQDCGAVTGASSGGPTPAASGGGGSPNTSSAPPGAAGAAGLLVLLGLAALAVVSLRGRRTS